MAAAVQQLPGFPEGMAISPASHAFRGISIDNPRRRENVPEFTARTIGLPEAVVASRLAEPNEEFEV
ncbi:hypothetical protein [Mesorhizobium sp.]|uniref:hypothetical protein n=1 Tax=Mesorhizobium sp. TaxID=1871066 RepID=UPI00257DFF8A|nr:hypothetical protein [Mesorhizobium sp.]